MKNLETISHPIEIVRETEKAVAILQQTFEQELMSRKLLRDFGTLVWLPKSQIEIVEGEVVAMADWLAKKNGFTTKKEIEAAESRRQAALDKYTEFVEFAKSVGVTGIRNRMKVATILNKAKEQGIALSY